MKTYLLFFFMLAVTQMSISQVHLTPNPFSILEQNYSEDDGFALGEYVQEVIPISNNRYLYITKFESSESLIPWGLGLEDLIPSLQKFTIADQNMNSVLEKNISDYYTETKEYSDFRGMFKLPDSNNIFLWGGGINKDLSDDKRGFTMVISEDLNIIEEHWFDYDFEHTDQGFIAGVPIKFIINNEGNYVYTGTQYIPGPDPVFKYFIHEINSNSETVNFFIDDVGDDFFSTNSFKQLANGNYASDNSVLKSDFSELNIIDFPNNIKIDHENIELIDSNEYIVAGLSSSYESPNLLKYETLLKIDTNYVFEEIYSNLIYERPFIGDVNLGWKTFKKSSTGDYLFSNVIFDGDNYQNQSEIILTNISPEGTMNWSYYFGDGAYYPLHIIPDEDGGCFLIVQSYHANFEFEKYESDVEYVHFDVNGAVLSTTASIEIDKSLKKVLIYPNPAKDHLHLEHIMPYADLNIKIYNTLGQLVLDKNVEEDNVDISNLSSGDYYYTLYNDKKLIQRDKIVVVQ